MVVVQANATRWVSPEPLNVTPALVGQPLASPARRSLAMLVDVCVVGLLSGVGGFWPVGGLVLVVLQLRSKRGGTDGAAKTGGGRLAVGWLIAALIAILAVQEAWSQWQAYREPARSTKVVRSAADAFDELEDDDRRAAQEGFARAASAIAGVASAGGIASQPLGIAQQVTGQIARELAQRAQEIGPAASAASAASAPADSELARAQAREQKAQRRIRELEAKLKQAREDAKSTPQRWREQAERFIDEIGLGLGWGIVYFALLPAWWGGQTVGKKLFGLRVVELTGQPMTVMRCLRRYGGYAAGMATGGIGFAQLLWDANRQAIQDRTAHTVVIDLRAPARGVVAVEAVAAAAAPIELADAPIDAPASPTPDP